MTQEKFKPFKILVYLSFDVPQIDLSSTGSILEFAQACSRHEHDSVKPDDFEPEKVSAQSQRKHEQQQ